MITCKSTWQRGGNLSSGLYAVSADRKPRLDYHTTLLANTSG